MGLIATDSVTLCMKLFSCVCACVVCVCVCLSCVCMCAHVGRRHCAQCHATDSVFTIRLYYACPQRVFVRSSARDRTITPRVDAGLGPGYYRLDRSHREEPVVGAAAAKLNRRSCSPGLNYKRVPLRCAVHPVGHAPALRRVN